MAQYREFNVVVFDTTASARITTTYGGLQQVSDIVHDGSFDTNYKNAMLAHFNSIASLKASSTSAPCYLNSTDRGKWLKMTASGTVVSALATVLVPTGNSGVLVVHLDPTGYTVKYSLAGGAFTTIADGGTITVTNGQTLKFEALAVASQDFVNGSVTDQDTGVLVDEINLFNSTP